MFTNGIHLKFVRLLVNALWAEKMQEWVCTVYIQPSAPDRYVPMKPCVNCVFCNVSMEYQPSPCFSNINYCLKLLQ